MCYRAPFAWRYEMFINVREMCQDCNGIQWVVNQSAYLTDIILPQSPSSGQSRDARLPIDYYPVSRVEAADFIRVLRNTLE